MPCTEIHQRRPGNKDTSETELHKKKNNSVNKCNFSDCFKEGQQVSNDYFYLTCLFSIPVGVQKT